MGQPDPPQLRPRRPLGEIALEAARGLLPALKVSVVVGTTLCLVKHTFASGRPRRPKLSFRSQRTSGWRGSWRVWPIAPMGRFARVRDQAMGCVRP